VALKSEVREVLVLQNNVQSVDDTGNVTQDGEEDVDEEIGAATALEEDTHGREDDGKDDLANVASGERHVVGCEDEVLLRKYV
jgi:hypothetical protein